VIAARWFKFAALFVGLVLLNSAWAAGLTATIDRGEARVHEQIVLSVRVEDAPQAQPRLPPLDGFLVRSRGSSTEMKFVNGRQSIAVVYTYVLIPQREGHLRVGPVTARFNGQQLQSEPFTVKVVAKDEVPAGDRALFMTSTISNEEPWVGEQVVYSLRFYRRVRIADAQISFSTPDGLHMEDIGRQAEFETTINGQRYVVTEIRKALFPTQSGRLEIPRAEITATVLEERGRRGLFGFANYTRRPVSVQTEPAVLEVRALPPAPDAFSGLVGEITLRARLGARRIGVGQSTSLEITLGGPVLLETLPDLSLGSLENFKTYEGEPTVQIDRGGDRFHSWKQLQVAMVPLDEGKLRIPEVAVTIFDPITGSYREVKRGPFVIEVIPGIFGPPQSDLAKQKSVLVAGGELAENYTGADALHPGSPLGLQLALMAAPGAGIFVLWGARRRKERWNTDEGLRRRTLALRRAQEGLAALAEAEDTLAVGMYSKVLRSYIGDKLGAEGAALTPMEVERLLGQSKLDESTRLVLVKQLRWAEELRYGHRADVAEAGALAAKAREFIQALESGL
jgi:hypothetical protein